MRIREATVRDAAAIARVQVDTWRTAYAGIVPEHHLASLSDERSERAWRDTLSAPDRPGFTYVTEDDHGNVIGFASGGPERGGDPVYKGEVYAIYLLQEHQRKGIGRQLTLTLARRLFEKGLRSMLVWVLAESPSRDFYTALGGKPLYDKPIEIGGEELIVAAYGWQDLSVLLEAHRQTKRGQQSTYSV